nr:putative capsid protein [Cordyceps militaris partitivirus 1]
MTENEARNIQDERSVEARQNPPRFSSETQVPKSAEAPLSTGVSTDPSRTARHLDLPNRGSITATPKTSVFAKDIDLPSNVIKISGEPHLIDVVPDSRHPTYVFVEYVQRTYSGLDFAPYSMVTPASVVGYLTYMFHAFIFLMDMYALNPISAYAEEVNTSHVFRKIVNEMSNAYVPDILFDALQGLLPHRLDIRNRLEFKPTYGSTLFNYDAPRLVAPSIFLLAHNQLVAQTKAANAYKTWLTKPVVRYNGETYAVGNLVGGLYQTTTGVNTENFLYRNWFFKAISKLADSATHRTHLRRPDILEFDVSTPEFTTETYNPYIHLLMLTSAERSSTLAFLNSLSKFSKDQLGATRSLNDFMTGTSSSICRTVISGPSSPTWNFKPLMDVNEETNLRSGSFRRFCESVGFCKPPPNNVDTIQVPYPEEASVIKRDYYLVSETNKESKLTALTPEEEIFLEPMVLLFDPYDDEASAHYSTLISGKVIENQNVDGSLLRLPNPDDSLSRNNSRNLLGALPLTSIIPQFSSIDYSLYPRIPRPNRAESLLAVLWNSGQIWLPFLNRTITRYPSLSMFALNEGVNGTRPSANIVAVNDHRSHTSVDEQVMLWSSYRFRLNSERPSVQNVFMYATLEPIFGTRSSLMQTYPLHMLLPLN